MTDTQAGAATPTPASSPAVSVDNAAGAVSPLAPTWAPTQWHGRMLVDQEGKHLGKLQDVYVDVEPEELHVATTAERVASAPDLDMHGDELSQPEESALYHHFQQNYLPLATASGRRLACR